MNGYVLNEYVNMDYVIIEEHTRVFYEPLEEIVAPGSLTGQICIVNPKGFIHFHQRDTYLLVAGDEVLQGQCTNQIVLDWKSPPGEHYLCVSYVIGESEPRESFSWLQEGF